MNKKYIKHLLSILLFVGLNLYIFNPVIFLNKQLKQHDIEQWSYSAKESSEFRKINNEEALWSNSMFSGMPAYLTDVKWSNEVIGYTHKLYSFFFPHPTNILLISFLSFYFMLLAFNVRQEVAVFGSIAFTLSSYMIVGIGAGHNARIGAIAYIPLIIAGVHTCIHKNRNLGFIVTAIALALQLRLNHLQITYYTLFILIFYGVTQLIYFYNKKKIVFFIKRMSLQKTTFSSDFRSQLLRFWIDFGCLGEPFRDDLGNRIKVSNFYFLFSFFCQISSISAYLQKHCSHLG